MSKFQLFDAVQLNEEVLLEEGGTAPAGTAGAIVEVFKGGEAYVVELFGRWVIASADGTVVESQPDEPNSFMETIGVETVAPQQIHLVTPASDPVGVRAQLLALMDELPEETLAEVKNFAESLVARTQSLNPENLPQH